MVLLGGRASMEAGRRRSRSTSAGPDRTPGSQPRHGTGQRTAGVARRVSVQPHESASSTRRATCQLSASFGEGASLQARDLDAQQEAALGQSSIGMGGSTTTNA